MYSPTVPRPMIHDPCVLTQIRNKGGNIHTARCFPWRNRSSAISVRIKKRYPSICGRRLKDAPARGSNTAEVKNAALQFPERSVAKP